MEIEKMRQAIIDALKRGEVSKRDLGKNKTLTKIVKGETVNPDSIKLAYSKLDTAREKKAKLSKTTPGKFEKENTPDRFDKVIIMNEIEELKAKIDAQNKEIEYLKSILDKKPQKKDNPDSILGFSIRIENTWTEGRMYEKYYAIKRIKKKLHRIYIGENPSNAKEKIELYCKKKNVIL